MHEHLNMQLSVSKRMHVLYMETTTISLDPFMPTKFEVGTELPSTICVYNIIERKKTKAVGCQYVVMCTFSLLTMLMSL